MDVVDEDILVCAGCEEQFICGDETDCSQCDDVFCQDCVNSVGKYQVLHSGVHLGFEPVCVACADAYIEAKQQERERWKPL